MATDCTFEKTKMCSQCPFRKKSAQGWLGSYTPREVIATIQQEVPFYCHSEINYEDENWKDDLSEKPHCAGALQMAKRMCKSPRDPEHAAAVKAIVVQPTHIGNHFDFIKHHED